MSADKQDTDAAHEDTAPQSDNMLQSFFRPGNGQTHILLKHIRDSWVDISQAQGQNIVCFRSGRMYPLAHFVSMGLCPIGCLGSGGCGDIFAVVPRDQLAQFRAACVNNKRTPGTAWCASLVRAVKIVLDVQDSTYAQRRMLNEKLAYWRLSKRYARAIPKHHTFWSAHANAQTKRVPTAHAVVTDVYPDGDCARWLEEVYASDRLTFVQKVAIACSVCIQVAASLATYHACNVVHCDVKLENALVDCDRTYKVTSEWLFPRVVLFDMDTALLTSRGGEKIELAVADPGDAASSCVGQRPGYTLREAQLQGTWLDWAPELARHEGAHPRTRQSDVWALGVAIWSVVHGCHPFDRRDQTDQQCLEHIVNARVRSHEFALSCDEVHCDDDKNKGGQGGEVKEAFNMLSLLNGMAARCMSVEPALRPPALNVAMQADVRRFAVRHAASCSCVIRDTPYMSKFRSAIRRITHSLGRRSAPAISQKE